MNSKQNQIRVLGQRSIASSFIFRSSNPAKDSKEDLQKKDSKKDSCISLSDFLDRKLHKNPLLPKRVKRKSKPFCSPLGPRDDGGSSDHQIRLKKEVEEKSYVLDQLIFEQFKHTNVEKGDGVGSCGDGEMGISSTSFGIDSCGVGEVGTPNLNNVQETRKRRNPFEGGDEKHTARKRSLVLGADSEPKQKRGKRFNSNKKTRPLYNHYANGSGWWDCDMEGVDSEEVGFGEIWEGVGSTTFGGIEWH